MFINEVKQDLFITNNDYALAHCISKDCEMDAGIAKQFKNNYPYMQYYLLQKIYEMHIQVPSTLLYVDDDTGRFVFNLITKRYYWDLPSNENFIFALKLLRDQCKSKNIKKLAIPRLGSGLDKLPWNEVKKSIEILFKDIDIEILICIGG